MFAHCVGCVRVIRYVDIFLLGVTMILPRGQGLFPISLSLFFYVCCYMCRIMSPMNLQWYSWRPPKASSCYQGVEECNWYNWKEGICILGLRCKLMLFYFTCSMGFCISKKEKKNPSFTVWFQQCKLYLGRKDVKICCNLIIILPFGIGNSVWLLAMHSKCPEIHFCFSGGKKLLDVEESSTL